MFSLWLITRVTLAGVYMKPILWAGLFVRVITVEDHWPNSHKACFLKIYVSHITRKLVFGVDDQVRLKLVLSAAESN